MTRSPTLNLAALLKATRMVGPRLRDAVWMQGCSIRCPGCANQAYLAPEPRRLVTVDRLLAHFQARLGKIDGISLLGGEPTEQAAGVASLLEGVHRLGLSTVVFSGRTLASLRSDATCADLLQHTDLLIDGPFLEAQKDLSLVWRGSRNQRLIRLSSYFTAEDLQPATANGEILVDHDRVLLHGIGTQALTGLSQISTLAGSDCGS